MKVAAVTITFNRLDLTQRTLESFNAKTAVDFHLFIDNGSTDGTREWIKGYNHIQLEENEGIAYAFATAVQELQEYDYILKLDNDVETVTDDIINRMLRFHELAGDQYVCSPVDLLLNKRYSPPLMGRGEMHGYNYEFVAHTGGAFQLIPLEICNKLCKHFRYLVKGDYMIGQFYRIHGYKPTYLVDLEMKHIGIERSTPGNLYRL